MIKRQSSALYKKRLDTMNNYLNSFHSNLSL